MPHTHDHAARGGRKCWVCTQLHPTQRWEFLKGVWLREGEVGDYNTQLFSWWHGVEWSGDLWRLHTKRNVVLASSFRDWPGCHEGALLAPCKAAPATGQMLGHTFCAASPVKVAICRGILLSCGRNSRVLPLAQTPRLSSTLSFCRRAFVDPAGVGTGFQI